MFFGLVYMTAGWACRGLMGLKVLWADPTTQVSLSQLSPVAELRNQAGDLAVSYSHYRLPGTQILSKRPRSHMAMPGSYSIHRPHRLFVPNCPPMPRPHPRRNRQSSCGAELATPPTLPSKHCTKAPGSRSETAYAEVGCE